MALAIRGQNLVFLGRFEQFGGKYGLSPLTIDLALVSRHMASRIQSCDVGDDIGSDHLPVHLTLASPQIQKQFLREILKYEKTDCCRFNKEIINNLDRLEPEIPEKLDLANEKISTIIKEGLDKACAKAKRISSFIIN